MFKFLKEKLSKAASIFSKKVEEESLDVDESFEEVEEKEILSEVDGTKVEHILVEKEVETEIVSKSEKPDKEEVSKEEKTEVLEEKSEVKEETKTDKIEDKEELIPSLDFPKTDETRQVSKTSEEITTPFETEEVSQSKDIKTTQEVDYAPPKEVEIQQEKPSIFQRFTQTITKKKLSEKKFDEIFWDLEVILMENNVATEVVEKIKSDLQKELVNKSVDRKKILETVENSLKNSISELFDVESFDLMKMDKKPFVIVFVGINGSGKTTTIAKIANLMKEKGKTCVLAAADTFRAASIEQLQLHADKLNLKLIKHGYNADPAAVAFDAIKHAQANNIDCVLVDTAGRMHSNVNLMEELKKVKRIASPDAIIFIGESITGNDCVNQAKEFNNAIGIDGIVLSKADIDEKGGAAISISYVTKKPILYLGTGQNYEDLEAFNPEKIISTLGL